MTFARCPWYIAGPLLGLLIVGLRATLNRPLGALGGFIDLAEHATAPRHFGVRAFMLIGIVLGGLVFAAASGTWSPTFHYGSASQPFWAVSPIAETAILLVAGMAMGFGARTAGGCTSGHGLTGMSLGSPASVVSTVTFFATAVVLAHVWVWLGGAS